MSPVEVAAAMVVLPWLSEATVADDVAADPSAEVNSPPRQPRVRVSIAAPALRPCVAVLAFGVIVILDTASAD